MEFSGLLGVDGLFKWNDIFTPAVQQPWQIRWFSNKGEVLPYQLLFSNHVRSGRSQTCGCRYPV